MIDAPVLIDGLERPLIPGTSLAGVLRTMVGDEDLWGTSAGPRDLTTSRATVFDAYQIPDGRVLNPGGGEPMSVVRNHVAIDRMTGTAVDTRLYSRAYLPAGTAFRCRILVEGKERTAVTEEARSIAAVLAGGGVAVGAGATNGNGRVRLEEVALRLFMFGAGGIVRALAGGVLIDDDCPKTSAGEAPAPGVLRFTIPFEAEGPLYSGVKLDGASADIIPLVQRSLDDEVRLLLPGSSIKGALRSHAERVERTAGSVEVDFGHDFDQQLAAAKVAGLLFGLSPGGGDEGAKGVVTVRDVASRSCVSGGDWDRVVNAGDEVAMLKAIKCFNNAGEDRGRFLLDLVARNAVDRFTGGVIDGALFTVLEPYADFESIVMDLDVDALRNRAEARVGDASMAAVAAVAAVALVLLTLRDGADGYVNFGAHGNRGAGRVSVDAGKIAISFGGSRYDARESDDAEWTEARELVERIAQSASLAAVLDDECLAKKLTRHWMLVIDDPDLLVGEDADVTVAGSGENEER